MTAKVGQFAKSTDAAPATQSISGLGFQPKLLFLWTGGAVTDDTFIAGIRASIGITAQTGATAVESGQLGFALTDNGSPPTWARRATEFAISIVSAAGVTLAQAVASFEVDGFTLEWTTNDANAYLISYLALAGDSFTDFTWSEWTHTIGAGNMSVVDVGFVPDLVIHTSAITNSARPVTLTDYLIGYFGAMASASGSTGHSTGWSAWSAVGYRSRWSLFEHEGGGYPSSAAVPFCYAAHKMVSMDADGFTVHNDVDPRWTNIQIYSLSIHNSNVYLGQLSPPPAPGVQSYGGIPFQPEAVLLFGSGTELNDHGLAPGLPLLLHVSAFDDSLNQTAMTCYDNAGTPNDSGSLTTNTQAYVVGYSPATIDKEAHIESINADGFSLHWTDLGVDEDPIFYIAFKGGPIGGTPATPQHLMPAQGGQGRRGYALTLKSSVIYNVESATPVDLSDIARDWTRSIRLQGGFWTGSFTMPAGKRAYEAFDSWMGCHIEERSGGLITWEGFVAEMELSVGGIVRRRSFDTMWNRVKATYTDLYGAAQETSWAVDQLSIDRYGQKDYILELGTMFGETAVALRDKYLEEHSKPYARAVSAASSLDNRLTVTANGYIFTLQWQYSTLDEYKEALAAGGPYGTFKTCPGPGEAIPCTCGNPGGSDVFEDSAASYASWLPFASPPPGTAEYTFWGEADVSGDKFYAWIGEVTLAQFAASAVMTYVHMFKEQTMGAGTRGYNGAGPGFGLGAEWYYVRGSMSQWVWGVAYNSPYFLYPGAIDNNTLPVKRDDDTVRYWDALYNNVLGDADGHVWRLWVGPGRFVNYQQLSTEPRWKFRDGQFLTIEEGEANPWALTPGVVRNMRGFFGVMTPDAWLTDPRDFLVDEFTVDASGTVTPHMAEIETSEFLIYYTRQVGESIGGTKREGPANAWGGGPMPPNWNVEAGTYNPPGPGGDLNGYWTEPSPGVYVWVHMMGLPGQPGP